MKQSNPKNRQTSLDKFKLYYEELPTDELTGRYKTSDRRKHRK